MKNNVNSAQTNENLLSKSEAEFEKPALLNKISGDNLAEVVKNVESTENKTNSTNLNENVFYHEMTHKLSKDEKKEKAELNKNIFYHEMTHKLREDEQEERKL